MLARYLASFNYNIAVLVPLPALNLCKTSCNCRLACIRVSIRASTTFHRVSSRPMPRMSVVPFGIKIRTVHPNYCGIPPVNHMCCTMSTIHSQCSIRAGVFDCYPGYTSLHHCLRCPAQRWVCPPTLCGCRWRTAVSASASIGILSFTLAGTTCITSGSPGVYGASFL